MNTIKDLDYWKQNCEENYITTPISVLRYITELEQALQLLQPVVIKSVYSNNCFCQDNQNYNRLICPKCLPNG